MFLVFHEIFRLAVLINFVLIYKKKVSVFLFTLCSAFLTLHKLTHLCTDFVLVSEYYAASKICFSPLYLKVG